MTSRLRWQRRAAVYQKFSPSIYSRQNPIFLPAAQNKPPSRDRRNIYPTHAAKATKRRRRRRSSTTLTGHESSPPIKTTPKGLRGHRRNRRNIFVATGAENKFLRRSKNLATHHLALDCAPQTSRRRSREKTPGTATRPTSWLRSPHQPMSKWL